MAAWSAGEEPGPRRSSAAGRATSARPIATGATASASRAAVRRRTAAPPWSASRVRAGIAPAAIAVGIIESGQNTSSAA